jgi:DNA topoisomerase VI subunit B
LKHTKSNNTKEWIGSQIKVMIAGNWSTYKARILHYFQQLAIITPYAKLQLNYRNKADPKRDLTVRYNRRSEQMPPPARQVKHHPASVNNLLIQQLAQQSKCQTLVKFLSTELASVSPALSKRLLDDLDLDESMSPTKLTNPQVTQLVQLLRSFNFKAPDGSCLSPLGEYNLNLGIRQVWEPDLLATARDRACAYEGHPFLVEAAVSLGGPHAKEGITVVRFANRIPLLFEGGADVATRVALTKIRWSQYKIDPKRDKLGVFCSIVSTKIPYKGTGKEYIGDDLEEIQTSVKRALQSCCQQLRVHLTKRNNILDLKQRKSKLTKYVPDIGRALFGILEGMRKRHREETVDEEISEVRRPHNATSTASSSKRLRLDKAVAGDVISKLDRKEITEDTLKQHLLEAIEIQNETPNDGEEAASTLDAKNLKSKMLPSGEEALLHPLFLMPIYSFNNATHDLHHPLFTFRPITQISRHNQVLSEASLSTDGEDD